jgi:HrpA-like RNA helicase
MVAVTQPRRVAAMTVAERVSWERRSTLGRGEVGYAVRFDDKSSPQTRIKYMTDGILVRECLFDPDLSKYDVLMLDEAHERSLNTDILFGLVKDVCTRRSDIKIIVTSATLSEEKFSKYFNHCPVLFIPGRIFPVDIYHSKMKQIVTTSGPSNHAYIESAAHLACKIHTSEGEGHILVFLTGQDEIDQACNMIHSKLQSEFPFMEDRELLVLPLCSSLPNAAQVKVFEAVSRIATGGSRRKFIRKCIVATNIAETSITVSNVRFVVDSGYVKQKTYNPDKHIESLVVVPISKVRYG